jgi:hypothetical protein
MAIPAQPVEVGPGQAIRLYACKALGAVGPYAIAGRYSLLSLSQKDSSLVTNIYC